METIQYPTYAARLVNDLARLLRSKRKTFASVCVLDTNAQGELAWNPIDWGFKGSITDAPTREYTRDEATVAARTLLQRCEGRKEFSDMPAVVSLQDRAIAKLLLTCTERNGDTPSSVVVLKRQRKAAAKTAKAERAAARLTKATDEGNYFTLKGVRGMSKVKFASEKDARKAYSKVAFGNLWWAVTEQYITAKGERKERAVKADDGSSLFHPDRADRLAEAPVVAHGNATLKTPKAAPAPASTADPAASINAAEAKALAKTLGASGADVKTKTAAVAFLKARGLLG